MNEHTNIHIGCQSWGYDDWITPAAGETVFYPRGTKSSDMLEVYSSIFDTIEVDSTVYGIPSESTFESWFVKSTPNFKFSLKAPRAITHELSLTPASYPILDEFLTRSSVLEEKLGAILIQLPAAFESTKENARNLRSFIERLRPEFRFAVEFRHPGWFIDWTFEELEKHSVALALVEGKWVVRELMFEAMSRLTPKIAYMRFMGERDLEKFDRVQKPQDDTLRLWADKIDALKAECKYIYMDNYFEGFAPETANKMKQLLKLPMVEPASLEDQQSLF